MGRRRRVVHIVFALLALPVLVLCAFSCCLSSCSSSACSSARQCRPRPRPRPRPGFPPAFAIRNNNAFFCHALLPRAPCMVIRAMQTRASVKAMARPKGVLSNKEVTDKLQAITKNEMAKADNTVTVPLGDYRVRAHA